ncbi:MAG TPA: acetoin utilization protein AcuC [Mycobacteriales bacterium]|nr:acetoin utilization protein AcuC [Mycobacteriales bacterium]
MADPAGTLVVQAQLAWDLGPGHPLRGIRLELAMELSQALGLLHRPGVRTLRAEPAGDELLRLAHDARYLEVVRGADGAATAVRGSAGGPTAADLLAAGLGGADTPVVPGLHARAAAAVGASVAGARALLTGEVSHAVALAGGWHHAHRAWASGFCVYNDVVIAIRVLLAGGSGRVCYVDLDGHHGDGVQAAFAADPRVVTVSIHQDGRTLFPGTGAGDDVGVGIAEGSAVNIALPPGTRDAGWLRAIDAVLPVVLRAADPSVVVLQCGCDGHRSDALTDLELTAEGFLAGVARVHHLAHECASGRLLVLGGGGYRSADAVPRVWTQVLAEVTGGLLPWDTELPAGWRARAARLAGVEPADIPTRLGDGADITVVGWDAGEGDADDPLDRAIALTRRAVLPLWGLDPLVDR